MPKPEKRFLCGAIEASIFENDVQHNGQNVKIKKVSFQKRYKSPQKGWQTTYSLDINDIPKAILVLSKAYEFLVMNTDSSVPSEKESPELAE